MSFKWSLNPYQGCVHGCHYCYARRYHGFLELDPGKPACPDLGCEGRNRCPQIFQEGIAGLQPHTVQFRLVTRGIDSIAGTRFEFTPHHKFPIGSSAADPPYAGFNIAAVTGREKQRYTCPLHPFATTSG